MRRGLRPAVQGRQVQSNGTSPPGLPLDPEGDPSIAGSERLPRDRAGAAQHALDERILHLGGVGRYLLEIASLFWVAFVGDSSAGLAASENCSRGEVQKI